MSLHDLARRDMHFWDELPESIRQFYLERELYVRAEPVLALVRERGEVAVLAALRWKHDYQGAGPLDRPERSAPLPDGAPEARSPDQARHWRGTGLGGMVQRWTRRAVGNLRGYSETRGFAR